PPIIHTPFVSSCRTKPPTHILSLHDALPTLVLPVDHQSAITETVRGKLQPLFGQQLGRKGMADPSQVPGQDRPSPCGRVAGQTGDRKSTRLNSSHVKITYAVFSLKIKKCTFE